MELALRTLTPAFTLIANGVDVTQTLIDNLVSLSLSDSDGDVADELTLVVSGNIARPKAGDRLLLSLGYKETGVHLIGAFFVQTTERENNSRLTITATSVNWNNQLKENRDAKYENTTVSGILSAIAQRHSLKVKSDCSDIAIHYIAQNDESDLEFLSRIADKYDLIYNIKNETITMFHRMKNNKKSDTLPHYVVDANECTALRIKHSSRRTYNRVEAHWRESRKNKHHVTVVGDGLPNLMIKGDFKSEADARTVATAQLNKSNRQTKTGNFSKNGIPMVAGGIVKISNAYEDSGDYSIKSITHNLDENGWNIDVEIEA